MLLLCIEKCMDASTFYVCLENTEFIHLMMLLSAFPLIAHHSFAAGFLGGPLG